MTAEQPELDGADISSDEAACAIRESCLVPYLELELAQASFTDMGNRYANPSFTLHPILDMRSALEPVTASCMCNPNQPFRHIQKVIVQSAL